MTKPWHTFFFLAGIFIMLALLMVFFPGGVDIQGFKLRVPALTDLFDTLSVSHDSSLIQLADLGRKVNKEQEENEMESSSPSLPDTSLRKKNADSLASDTLHLQKELFNVQHVPLCPIEYPEGREDLLYPFFRLLASGAADTSLIRILHYGDSQIERDRVTSYLRNMFQTKFGGGGPGLLPAVQPYGKLLSVFHEASGEWKRYTSFGKVDYSLGHRRYGPMAALYRLTCPGDEDSICEATITIRKNKFSYAALRRFTRCQLLLGNCADTLTVSCYADGLLMGREKHPAPFLHRVRFTFPEFTEEITLHLTAREGTEVYGFTLDAGHGIAVDNIAMRGSAGMEFTHIDPVHLKMCYELLKPKLLILEFGGNIAPTQASNYTFYGKRLYHEISFLKSLLPSDVPLIVIGIGDMSLKENGQYVSYPNLTHIRDEMKKAAFKAGCAYWDLLKAMGGPNSMPLWVAARPPLATRDYVHFTDLGARVMGKMFCAALNQEYERYVSSCRRGWAGQN